MLKDGQKRKKLLKFRIDYLLNGPCRFSDLIGCSNGTIRAVERAGARSPGWRRAIDLDANGWHGLGKKLA